MTVGAKTAFAFGQSVEVGILAEIEDVIRSLPPRAMGMRTIGLLNIAVGDGRVYLNILISFAR
jgi:hypothetical protein